MMGLFKKKKKVYIIRETSPYTNMFLEENWEVVNDIGKATILQFVGGADISPSMYKRKRHPSTISDWKLDKREEYFFKYGILHNLPMAGICRGGQFLNVMCGGELYQDVDNHTISGTHSCRDVLTNKIFEVTSTHHQIMVPGVDSIVLGVSRESTYKIYFDRWHHERKIDTKMYDNEIILYKKRKTLCFQPHPEFPKYPELRKIYFEYLNTYLL